jgi:hypothetical protein
MKKWLLMAALAGLLLCRPFRASDVARLKPVEIIRVSQVPQGIRVETDTGDTGEGADLVQAFADLKQTASGDIFLETADRLLVSPHAVELLPKLTDYLRPGCNICVEMGQIDMESVGAFLRIHEPGVTLQDHRAGETALPVLCVVDGRMYLVE